MKNIMKLCGLLTAAAVLWGVSGAAARADDTILIPGERIFPESMSSTKDGTFYIGSIGTGAIFRVMPGENTAAMWIQPGTGGLMGVLGVLADEKHNTLWACSFDPGQKKPSTLFSFNLKTGAPKGAYPLPGVPSFCNDIAIGPDGAAYVTNTLQPVVLRLAPGGRELKPWVTNPALGGKGIMLDGIAWGSDGNLYVNLFDAGKMFRIHRKRNGRAGAVVELTPSLKLDHPDGLRPFGRNQFIMAEGQGRADLVTIDGNDAQITVLKDGYKGGIVAVAHVGNSVWALEGQLAYLFDPSLKDKQPEPFRAYEIPLTGMTK